ncbi:DegV family protein [Lachnotalea sp. AF33-28]|jgi:DegV family protein with EDD domain|uniref:DegV family protein n=1 Tax=Lachnotalea sp. AF33-28 TaxID=2292046 RepID=UPI000E497D6E|nr:DegV family protein [Lachnotalea sp. AF33-28]RHP31965.1 DegV family protein [Lachnotalea sp. AF33-28]
MNSFAVITDSASDLPKEYLESHDLKVAPLYYIIDNKTYGGETELDPKEFYSMMRSGKMPTTQAVNPETARELMKAELDAGRDVLYLAFSSGLSSSCQSAALVGNELKEEYPDRKIVVIDTLCASLGQGLLVHKALEMREKGMSVDETAEGVRELVPHLCHQFTVNDLFHLHRGGRVSKATAILGTMVNVKPVMHVDDEGHLVPVGTVRGRKRSLNALVDNMEKKTKNYAYKNDCVFISHGDCLEDAQYVAEQIKSRFGIDKALIGYVSPTIGAHSGPGTLALFFVGESR